MAGAPISRRRVVFWLALCSALIAPLVVDTAPQAQAAATVTLPRKDGSLRFAVVGDMGRDSKGRYDVAKQVAASHNEFPFDFVILLGDNVYGAIEPADMRTKFEAPYKLLLDAGVVFHAVIGNHDNPNVRFYKPFNMGDQRYYSFREPKGAVGKGLGSVRFFALDTGYLDKEQLAWLDGQLAACDSEWRIVFFHHPLYSSGSTHGSALESRAVLEPLFVKYGVSTALSGHDHFYERIKPQKGGVVYWVSGGGGSLRKGDIRATDMTAKAFDRDYHFMIVEIAGDELYFQAISRTGHTIDSGAVHRPGAPAAGASTALAPAPVPATVPAVSPAGRSAPSPAPPPR